MTATVLAYVAKIEEVPPGRPRGHETHRTKRSAGSAKQGALLDLDFQGPLNYIRQCKVMNSKRRKRCLVNL